MIGNLFGYFLMMSGCSGDKLDSSDTSEPIPEEIEAHANCIFQDPTTDDKTSFAYSSGTSWGNEENGFFAAVGDPGYNDSDGAIYVIPCDDSSLIARILGTEGGTNFFGFNIGLSEDEEFVFTNSDRGGYALSTAELQDLASEGGDYSIDGVKNTVKLNVTERGKFYAQDFLTSLDIDGDGKNDLLVTYPNDKVLAVYPGLSSDSSVTEVDPVWVYENLCDQDSSSDAASEQNCGTKLVQVGESSILLNAPGKGIYTYSFDDVRKYGDYDFITNTGIFLGESLGSLWEEEDLFANDMEVFSEAEMASFEIDPDRCTGENIVLTNAGDAGGLVLLCPFSLLEEPAFKYINVASGYDLGYSIERFTTADEIDGVSDIIMGINVPNKSYDGGATKGFGFLFNLDLMNRDGLTLEDEDAYSLLTPYDTDSRGLYYASSLIATSSGDALILSTGTHGRAERVVLTTSMTKED